MSLRALALLVAAVLTACSGAGGDGGEGTTTIPSSPSSTETTTTTAVSYAVPETIDVAYVEKVMEALDHLDGEAARHLATTRELDETFVAYLTAIYAPAALDLVNQVWYEVAGGNFEMLAERPGDPETEVQRLLSQSSTCILFASKRDFSAVFVQPDPPRPQRYTALIPLLPGRNIENRNPTPWMISFDGRFEDGSEPTAEEACAAS